MHDVHGLVQVRAETLLETGSSAWARSQASERSQEVFDFQHNGMTLGILTTFSFEFLFRYFLKNSFASLRHGTG